MDSGCAVIMVSPCFHGHHDLFERAVAGPLADAVDRAFDLPGADGQRGEAIGDGQPQVVVTMRAEDGLVGVGHPRADVLEELARFRGGSVPDRVGKIDRPAAAGNRRFDDAAQEVAIAPRRILRRKLHIVGEPPRERDAGDDRLEARVASDPELAREVQIRGREENVQPSPLPGLQSPGSLLDVQRAAPRQRGDDRPAHLA